MPIKPFIILCTLLYFPFLLIAQADKYQGTWQAIGILSGDSSNSYSITLQIAAGEKKQLYPAQLKINLKEFSATYELLLVKKTTVSWQLAVIKYP